MKFIFSLFLVCYSFVSFAQPQRQISFNQLSVNDGLSQNSVVSIAQDKTGYLWFATQDGLNKYDGKQFTYYDKLFEDITRDDYSRLGKIYIDNRDSLFIITKNGHLERFSPNTNSFKPVKNILNVSNVYSRNNKTWIGTYGNGLFKCTTKDTIQLLNNTDLFLEVYAFESYREKTVVAAKNAVFIFEDENPIYTKLAASYTQDFAYSSLAVMEDELWVGSFGNGLYYLDSNTEQLEPFQGFGANESLPENLNIETLLFDTKGRLWIGTYGNGAFLINFETQKILHFITEYSNPGAIHYNDILSIHQDYTGTIWLGTDGGGLSYYDENLNKFNILTNNQTPIFANVDVVRAITVDKKGIIWIGTSGKGLTYYNPELEKYYSYTEQGKLSEGHVKSNRIVSLLSDDDALWIGYQDAGLSILTEGVFTDYNLNTNPRLDAITVWCIYKDSDGIVWLGTAASGIIQFDPEKGVIKQYVAAVDSEHAISSNNIRTITEGAPGELWIGTEDQGINRFFKDSGRFITYTKDEFKNVKSMYYADNLLWIGTNGEGLVRFDTNSQQSIQISQDQGLPNNVIYGVLPGALNELWLSSNRGISKVSLDKNNEVSEITNYDIYDGLQSFEFNTGAHYKDQKGQLYFGGLKGINWFQPDYLQFNTAAPRTVLTKLEVLNVPTPLLPNSAFAYNQNTVSFTFAGLHFSQPERNSYTYFLEGYDSDWSQPLTSNFARYAKLPPGDYTFKALSSNYDDVWGTSPATYSFRVNPPWYWTLWAKIGYLLLFLFIVYIVYRYLKSRWQMQLELKLEHAETERLKKLDELKSKLYTNISHEFRTPLTLISGPIQQLVANSQLSANDMRALNIIEGSSERMLSLVNQLLDLSKLEEGSVTLQVGNYNMTPQLSQILEAFSLKANEKGITIISRIDEIKDAWYDKDAMEKIVSNLLSNAIKYAPENSSVLFIAEKKQDYLSIVVENDNTSLKEKDIPFLYNRFFQADKNTEGVGIGLSLIKELITLSNGKISAKKKTPETITFSVLLPISQHLYNANNLIVEKENNNVVPTEESPIFEYSAEDPPILLVVEDNLEVRNYIVSLFTESFKVLEAEDGLEGVKKAIEHIPDIIISDIMMPKKDGVALCNTLKQDSRTSHISIILLTAKAGDTAILEGLQNQADDYITKPFNPSILTQKIKNIIAAQQALRERYSQHVYLSPKEIAVTSYDETFLESLQTIIDTHITESDFSSEDFAKALGLSRMQLHRKLKALTGLSTSEFIRSQRLKASLKLLEDSDLSVSEVAYSVGFNTPSYFIKCFKEAYKITPAAYFKKE